MRGRASLEDTGVMNENQISYTLLFSELQDAMPECVNRYLVHANLVRGFIYSLGDIILHSKWYFALETEEKLTNPLP